jgi:hypothetical protein
MSGQLNLHKVLGLSEEDMGLLRKHNIKIEVKSAVPQDTSTFDALRELHSRENIQAQKQKMTQHIHTEIHRQRYTGTASNASTENGANTPIEKQCPGMTSVECIRAEIERRVKDRKARDRENGHLRAQIDALQASLERHKQDTRNISERMQALEADSVSAQERLGIAHRELEASKALLVQRERELVEMRQAAHNEKRAHLRMQQALQQSLPQPNPAPACAYASSSSPPDAFRTSPATPASLHTTNRQSATRHRGEENASCSAHHDTSQSNAYELTRGDVIPLATSPVALVLQETLRELHVLKCKADKERGAREAQCLEYADACETLRYEVVGLKARLGEVAAERLHTDRYVAALEEDKARLTAEVSAMRTKAQEAERSGLSATHAVSFQALLEQQTTEVGELRDTCRRQEQQLVRQREQLANCSEQLARQEEELTHAHTAIEAAAAAAAAAGGDSEVCALSLGALRCRVLFESLSSALRQILGGAPSSSVAALLAPPLLPSARQCHKYKDGAKDLERIQEDVVALRETLVDVLAQRVGEDCAAAVAASDCTIT